MERGCVEPGNDGHHGGCDGASGDAVLRLRAAHSGNRRLAGFPDDCGDSDRLAQGALVAVTTWERVWVGILIVMVVVLGGPYLAFAAGQSLGSPIPLVAGPQGWYPKGTPPPYKITEDVAKMSDVSVMRPGELQARVNAVPSIFLTNTLSGGAKYEWRTSLAASGHAGVTSYHTYNGIWKYGAIQASESQECSGVLYYVEWARLNFYPFAPVTYSMWSDSQEWNWGGSNTKFYLGLAATSDRFSSTYPTVNYRGLRGSFRQVQTDIIHTPPLAEPIDLSGAGRGSGFRSAHRALVLAERTATGWDLTAKIFGGNQFLGTTVNDTATVHGWSSVGPTLSPDFTITGAYQSYGFDLLVKPYANPADDAWLNAQYQAAGMGGDYTTQQFQQDDYCVMATARYHTAAEARAAWNGVDLSWDIPPVSDEGTLPPETAPGIPDPPDVDNGGSFDALKQFGASVGEAIRGWLWFLDPWDVLDGGNS